MQRYDSRTDAALSKLVSTLDADTGSELIETLNQCADAAADGWKSLFGNSGPDEPVHDNIERRPRRPGAGTGLLPDDEDEDEEHPDAVAASTRTRIQKAIMSRLDARRLAVVKQSMHDTGDIPGLNRMNDLQHKDQDHSWLWHCHRTAGRLWTMMST